MEEKVEAVQRMQDYIKNHIDDKINLAEIGKASFFSPWYARRIFIELLGVTPAEYVRKLKLSNAVLSLRDEKTKIIDTALDFGFNSVDGFQRAFYKEFGCNPKEYARHPIPLSLFIPYGVKYQRKGENKLDKENQV